MESSVALCIIIAAYSAYKLLDWLYRRPRLHNTDDRHILVTGCDHGFGNMLAKRLDALGCHVFAACLTEAGEAEVNNMTSSRCKTVPLDVTSHKSILDAVDFVKRHLPEKKGLWGLVNNAGIWEAAGPPEFLDLKAYQRSLDVNVLGLLDVTLAFLPLLKQEQGRVVNVSSMFGRFSFPWATPYCISKYGVEAFTDGLRRAMVPWEVRAILIEPGFHNTPLNDPKHVADVLRNAYQRAPSQCVNDYGPNFIENAFAFTKRIVSSYPENVVAGMEHALLAKHPRARYLIGWDAHVAIQLGRLPERLGDWLFWKVTRCPTPAKLPSNAPEEPLKKKAQ